MVGNTSISQWPKFLAPVPDPVLGEVYAGKNGFTPEQSLVEFISTSAAFHGVKKQALRSLEWDLLKVFVNNVMPANAAAWYMAKRKFYMDQAFDQQLLPHVLKKHPDKFRVVGDQVHFLEVYSKEVAKMKLQYLLHHGLFAYFDHKADDYGVYFFDPFYYQNTEPFHEALKVVTGNRVIQNKLVTTYFSSEGMQQPFNFKHHTANLVSICKQPGVKVITNTTGVIVSMINSQYGFVKFGAGEKALFCTKSLFRDGWNFSGDPLKLPAIKIDGYQIPDSKGEKTYSWYAVLVWCGRRPSPKYCSTAEDLKSTPVFREGRLSTVSSAGDVRKLRQPSSSMMIGKVVEVRRNGAVLRVRDDGPDKVFVPGWMRKLSNKAGTWLSTASGECIGLGDLVAYYVDTEVKSGYIAVGKNVMVLKESKEVEEEENGKRVRRRRRKSRMISEATVVTTAEETVSESDEESVTGEELAWLEEDLTNMIKKEDPAAKTLNLLRGVHSKLHEVSTRSKNFGKVKPDRPGYTPMDNKEHSFWRMKKMFASLDPGYHSESDEDYKPGDEVETIVRRALSTSKSESEISVDISRSSVGSRKRTITASSNFSQSRRGSVGVSMKMKQNRSLPYWVRALSRPEVFDPDCGKFVPVDKMYDENKDPDYELPETDAEDDEEVEDDVPLEELLKESCEELPAIMTSGTREESVVSPVKITLSSPEETSVQPGSLEAGALNITEQAGEEDEGVGKTPPVSKPAVVPLWVRELQGTEQDEEYDSDEDPEFIPPAVITDTDVDYDEFSDDDSTLDEELKLLASEASAPLVPPPCYIPVWVRVDSPEERIARAKEVELTKQMKTKPELETSGKDTEGDHSSGTKDIGKEIVLDTGLETPAFKSTKAFSTVCGMGDGFPETGLTPAMKMMGIGMEGTLPNDEGKVEEDEPKPARENPRKRPSSDVGGDVKGL